MSAPPPGARRAAYVLPAIPDTASDDVKNSLAIRNACAIDGVCPDCGAIGELAPDKEMDGAFRLTFAHEPGCRSLQIEDIR